MEQNIPTTQTEEKNGAGIFSIMFEVFTAPAKAFEQYVKNPSITVPLIILLVLAAAYAVVTVPYNTQLQADMLRNSTLPAEIVAQMQQGSGPISAAIGAAISFGIITVLEALVAWFLGVFIFGGQSKFKPIWGVVILSGLIIQAGNLLRLPLVLAKDSVLVSYGLAAFLPGKDFTSILYFFLYSMDAFMIWGTIVAGIGFGVIFGLSRGKGYFISFGLTLLFVCVMMASMLFGMSFIGVEINFL